jgi:RimJ/RimL family protein N-acetyltransferase
MNLAERLTWSIVVLGSAGRRGHGTAATCSARAAGMSERLEPPVADVVKTRSAAEAVTIRAIRPDDGVRIVRAFQALEPRSIYLRFFSPKRELSAEEVRRVSEPDPARQAALVATVATGDREEIIVGLGEYVGAGASAHIAFAIEEDYQGRGIASRLLERLARLAREKGISRFEADVLAGNTPMLKVLRRSGLPMTESGQDGVVHVTLTLGDGTA